MNTLIISLYLSAALANPCPIGDTDLDGISNVAEDVDNNGDCDNDDSDLDGTADYLDPDDDGDGLSTFAEGTGDLDCNAAAVPMGDGIPNYLDLDSDGDGVLDIDEGEGDDDADLIPNYLDCEDSGCLGDADNDGLSNCDEMVVGTDGANPDTDGDGVRDGIEVGLDPYYPLNTDGDDVIDAFDTDDDDDGVATFAEDGNGNGDYLDDDLDCDNIPDFRDDLEDGPCGDLDDDGLSNELEAELGLKAHSADSDEDGLLDADEVGDPLNPTDTDGDGIIDALDVDDDNDGWRTIDEDPEADVDCDGIGDPWDADSFDSECTYGGPDLTVQERSPLVEEGCGCATGGSTAPFWMLALVALAGRRRTRLVRGAVG